MTRKARPVLKAFVLCDDLRQYSDKADLFGAGMGVIKSRSIPAFPFKHTFWSYVLLADEKPEGQVQLVIVRADSGRSYSLRKIALQHPDPLKTAQLAIRVFNCEFPEPGVYLVELWYDGEWLLDHRLEVEG
jgi:hypothetical protein